MREAWIESPWTVKLAIILVLANVGVGAIISLFTQTIDASDYAFEVIIRILGVLILLAFASRLLVGRNWARIVLTVIVGLEVLAAGFDITARIYAFTPLALAQIVPSVLAVILLWVPASRQHFTPV